MNLLCQAKNYHFGETAHPGTCKCLYLHHKNNLEIRRPSQAHVRRAIQKNKSQEQVRRASPKNNSQEQITRTKSKEQVRRTSLKKTKEHIRRTSQKTSWKNK